MGQGEGGNICTLRLAEGGECILGFIFNEWRGQLVLVEGPVIERSANQKGFRRNKQPSREDGIGVPLMEQQSRP